jgi:hypothetical protein
MLGISTKLWLFHMLSKFNGETISYTPQVTVPRLDRNFHSIHVISDDFSSFCYTPGTSSVCSPYARSIIGDKCDFRSNAYIPTIYLLKKP